MPKKKSSDESSQIDFKNKCEKKLILEEEHLQNEIVYNNIVDARNSMFLEAMKNLPHFLENKNNYIINQISSLPQINGLPTPVIANILSHGYFAGASPKYDSTKLAIAFESFKEIVAEINLKYIFVPTKQNFCQYLGISIPTYNSYLRAREADMRETAEVIEDYIVDCTLASAQSGYIKESTSLYRMRAEKQGHAIKETKQTVEFNMNTNKMTPQEMLEDLKSKGLLTNK